MITRILTVTHKNFDDSILPSGYQVIRVGNSTKKEHDNWITDSIGEKNMSEQNPWYCELTAQYWAWKNDSESDVLGLVHYRRYFMDYKRKSMCFAEDIMSTETIENILYRQKYDVIVPMLSSKHKGFSTLYSNKPLEEQDKHWRIISMIISKDYPEYVDAFNKVLYGKEQLWFNMIIARRKEFFSYSEWLFGVLARYDDYIKNVLHEDRIARIDGFLSEVLTLVWVRANIDDRKVKYCDVKNIEANSLKYDKSWGSFVRKVIYCNPSILKCLKAIKKRLRIFKEFYL